MKTRKVLKALDLDLDPNANGKDKSIYTDYLFKNGDLVHKVNVLDEINDSVITKYLNISSVNN